MLIGVKELYAYNAAFVGDTDGGVLRMLEIARRSTVVINASFLA
jgi:hypothetical protein